MTIDISQYLCGRQFMQAIYNIVYDHLVVLFHFRMVNASI